MSKNYLVLNKEIKSIQQMRHMLTFLSTGFQHHCSKLKQSPSLYVLLGGGFRDSLADMAEELCPSSSDSPMPLPFFVRSPNQVGLPSHEIFVLDLGTCKMIVI